jgi:hypothetical protein
MSFALKVAAISAVLVFVLGLSAAIAYPPYVGAPCGYGFCGGWWPGLWMQGNPPYFALYPPVYYSHPVPRPYGFSPYAYPPGTMTPEVVRVQPLMVLNGYVPNSVAVAQPTKTTSPLRIRNPFVDKPQVGLAAFDGLTGLPASKPQIIFPTRVDAQKGL